jgi:hypothetical protein
MGETEAVVAAAVVGSWLGATTSHCHTVREVSVLPCVCEDCEACEAGAQCPEVEPPAEVVCPKPEGVVQTFVHGLTLSEDYDFERFLVAKVFVLVTSRWVLAKLCACRRRDGGRRGRIHRPSAAGER